MHNFMPLTWPEFIKQFPKEAAAHAESLLDDLEMWDEDEIADAGGPDPMLWDVLYDSQCFINKDGEPTILANRTGPGGALWLRWNEEDGMWDEAMYDADGNLEDF